MRLLKALVVAATTLSVVAGPIRFNRRDQDPNVLVLQFASVLENLESQFYQQGIQKFSDSDFQNAGFTSVSIVTEQLTTIQADEAAHLDFLTKALSSLGSSAPDNCQFNFDSVLTDVATMAATARVVELVGVGAYLGAAGLITNPQILVAAGSILTIEARHQTVLNAMSGVGSPIPQAFDLALAPGEVLAIAGAFIQGCDLGIPSNKPLSVTNSAPPQIGDLVQFSFDGMSGMSNLHCQMLLPGSVNSISLPIDQCIVPQGVNGAVAIFITADQQPLANNVILRPMANSIIAGPVIAFIDSQPSPLSQLLRAGASSGGVSNTSSNITLDQAGQIISEGSSSDQLSSSSSDGPNLITGTEAGGVIIVDGWTNLPGQDLSGQNENQDNSMSSYQSGSMNSYQGQDSSSMQGQDSSSDSNSMQSEDSSSGSSSDSNSMQSEDSMNSMDQNMNSYPSQNSDSMQSEDSMNSYNADSMNSMDQNMNSDQSQNSDSMQNDSMNSMQSDDSMQNQDMNNNQDNSSLDLSGSSSDSSTEAPASSDGSS